MRIDKPLMRLASLPVFLAGGALMTKVFFFPFVALFAFDDPNGPTAFMLLLAAVMVAAPFCVAASMLLALANGLNPSLKILAAATALLVLPGMTFAIVSNPMNLLRPHT